MIFDFVILMCSLPSLAFLLQLLLWSILMIFMKKTVVYIASNGAENNHEVAVSEYKNFGLLWGGNIAWEFDPPPVSRDLRLFIGSSLHNGANLPHLQLVKIIQYSTVVKFNPFDDAISSSWNHKMLVCGFILNNSIFCHRLIS